MRITSIQHQRKIMLLKLGNAVLLYLTVAVIGYTDGGSTQAPAITAAQTTVPGGIPCKTTMLGHDYKGTLAVTKSGRTCQAWNSNTPHYSHFRGARHGLDKNYCRNEGSVDGGPWCYTMDKNKRWEYCDIKLCPGMYERTTDPNYYFYKSPMFHITWPTKYVKVFLVYNKDIYDVFYKTYGSDDAAKIKIKSHAMESIEILDKAFKQINVRMLLAGYEVWDTGDKISVTTSYRTLKQEFRMYSHNILRKTNHIDTSVYIYGGSWDGGVGGAGMGDMCGASNANNEIFVMAKRRNVDPLSLANILGHEFGHQFHQGHNYASTVPCPTYRIYGTRCIMGGNDWPKGFSSNFLYKLRAKDSTCLDKIPQQSGITGCGNGIIEHGEECDCGSSQVCKDNNPCCDGKICKLKGQSQCSSETCCTSCMYDAKKSGCSGGSGEYIIQHHGGMCLSYRESDNNFIFNSNCGDELFSFINGNHLQHVQSKKCLKASSTGNTRIYGENDCADVATSWEYMPANSIIKHVISAGFCICAHRLLLNPPVGTLAVIWNANCGSPFTQFTLKRAITTLSADSAGYIKNPTTKNYNVHMHWKISVSNTAHRIKLFLKFNIGEFGFEFQEDCRYDYIEVRDGGNDQAPLIGKYCGIPKRVVLESTSNELFVTYHADSSYQSKFQLGYRNPQTYIEGTEDCKKTKMGLNYVGKLNKTESGRDCQAWNSQSPHTHYNTPQNVKDAHLESNYCRNPNYEPKPWCYTTDKAKKWEFCDIDMCM